MEVFTQINTTQYKKLLKFCLQYPDWSLMVVGKAGIGKTQIAKEIATEANAGLVEIYLSIREPFDLIGAIFPVKTEKGMVSVRAISEIMKRAWDEYNKKQRVVLLFDEFTHANKNVLKSLYQLLLERKIEDQELPPNTLTILIGNLDYEGLGWSIEEFPKAFLDRCIRVELTFSFDEFFDYAIKRDFHSSILGFIKWKPEMVEKLTPRTLERCSNTLKIIENLNLNEKEKRDMENLLLRVIMGEAVYGTYKIWKETSAVNVFYILDNFDKVKLSEEQFIAFVIQLAYLLKDKSYWDKVAKIIYKFPQELLLFLLRSNEEFKCYVMEELPEGKKIFKVFKEILDK